MNNDNLKSAIERLHQIVDINNPQTIMPCQCKIILEALENRQETSEEMMDELSSDFSSCGDWEIADCIIRSWKHKYVITRREK